MIFAAALVLLLAHESCAGKVQYYPAPEQANSPNVVVEHMWLSNARQAHIKATVTRVHNPVGFTHVLTADADEGCVGRQRTSVTATAAGCLFAVNAGPFIMDGRERGACEGSIVSNGTVFQVDSDSGYSSFGLTSDGRYAFGDVSAAAVKREGITELVSGFVAPLIVDASGTCLAHSEEDKIAQRQAVGIDSEGVLIFLTIDGDEYALLPGQEPRGMFKDEVCAALLDLGVVVALNLDGGGSTTTWYDGDYANRPTCNDYVAPSCERTVASVLCVMP